MEFLKENQALLRLSSISLSLSYLHTIVKRLTVASILLYVCLQCPVLKAAPSGGNIVGGVGSISQSDFSTSITQNSASLAIDWQSFNVSVDERVQFIQPNSNSIALNRVLGSNASHILGQVDANGHLILVNPNGVFFSPTAVLNVGGLIASGLDINPDDFMNGHYFFSEVMGSEGSVINSGVINASLGGSVTLLGRQIRNDGLIMAKLGAVNLAAGKEAVLTFDDSGLMGIKVTEAILQNELGVDPAVLNSGEIVAEGGRILLTASVSKDVFSQAVNTGDISQATSVVVNEDGSFTLGSGSDVVNSGVLNVSRHDEADHTLQAAGQLVLLGENVSNSGTVLADVQEGAAGNIELHAKDTVKLMENSLISARSERTETDTANKEGDAGGTVKVLGKYVGVFDQSTIDVSGAHGGGQILIGGGYQGDNSYIQNAEKTIVSENSRLIANSLIEGDGGRVIVWADDFTQFYGEISATAGHEGGNGGFAEVSGKENLIFAGLVDLTALNEEKGTLLLDPKNITISTDSSSHTIKDPSYFEQFTDIKNVSSTLNNTILANALNGADVELRANTSIYVNADVIVDPASSTNSSLTLEAGHSISVADNISIELIGGDFNASINDERARISRRDNGNATFTMGTGSSIVTNGGNISIAIESLNTLDSSIILNGNLNAGAGTISFLGNEYNNTFTISSGLSITANTITIDGGFGDDIFNIGSSIAGTIDGGDGADTFNILASGISASIDGGISVDTLNENTLNAFSATTLTSWIFDSGESGQLSNASGTITYHEINSIIAGDGDDVFKFLDNSVSFSSILDGQGGSNTLIGHNLTNTWKITDNNEGALSNSAVKTSGINYLEFANIQSIIGGSEDDTFVLSSNGDINSIAGGEGNNSLEAHNKVNTWEISGKEEGTLDNNILASQGNTRLAFTSIQKLIGGTDSDNFSLGANGSLTGLGSINVLGIDGGGGNDTLNAKIDTENTWTITSSDKGKVTGIANFTRIDNLVGGNLKDTFTFETSGGISGLIDGGAGLDDAINISAVSSTRVVNILLSGEEAGSASNIIDVSDIEIFKGNNNSHTLQANDVDNVWTITSANGGSLDSDSYNISFNGFVNLNGGASDDVFRLGDNGNVKGTIDGGGHVTADIVDYSLITGSVVVNVGGAFQGIDNVEIIQGNNTSSTLIGDNTINTWDIDGENDGTLTGINGDTRFLDFNYLQGGDLEDTFNVSGEGAVTGSIFAKAGDDVLNITLSGAEVGQLTFVGGNDTDTVYILNGNSAYAESYIRFSEDEHKLVFTQDLNIYNILLSESENINDNAIVETLSITGKIGDDIFTLGTDTFAVKGDVEINYLNKTNLVVDGLGGQDEVIITEDISIPGFLEFNVETLSTENSATISASTLALQSVNNILTKDGFNKINTNVNNLRLSDVGTSVYIQEADNINLLELDIQGAFNLESKGNITDGEALTFSNELILNANNANIILDNDNQLSGLISLFTTEDAILNNVSTINLNHIEVQNLNLSSGDNIADTDLDGSISVNGLASFNSRNDIVLDGADVNLNQLEVTSANTFRLIEKDALNIDRIEVASNIDISAGGDISIGLLQTTGTASLNAGGQITDINDVALNIIASRIVLQAVNGIGNGEALETQTATLNVINESGGRVELDNIGSVTLEGLKNNGDIVFNNDKDINFKSGSVDAGFNTGTLLMTTEAGSFLGLGNADSSNPDITAYSAVFLGLQGTFGTLHRPLVLNVQDSVLIHTRSSLNPIFAPNRPRVVEDRSLLQFSAFDAINTLSGEQLVEVETLAEVDPAIFTDLQNYASDEIAIRMPRDQLFDDELEEFVPWVNNN